MARMRKTSRDGARSGPGHRRAGRSWRGTRGGSSNACGGIGAVTRDGVADGSTYLIQCPSGAWNGTLFLYSHGYVVPNSANPAQDVTDPATEGWLLANGYAIAGLLLRDHRLGREVRADQPGRHR